MKFFILKLEDVKGETWQTHHGPLGAPMSLLGERRNGLLTTLAGHVEEQRKEILKVGAKQMRERATAVRRATTGEHYPQR